MSETIPKAAVQAKIDEWLARGDNYSAIQYEDAAAELRALLASASVSSQFCDVIHVETGAHCELPPGHEQNHRGQFDNGIAQWPKAAASSAGQPPRGETAQLVEDARMGHLRLDECADGVETKGKPLYDRISAKIQKLADENTERGHIIAACAAEKDELRARAESAKHREAAAEYRAQRIVLDAELKTRITELEAALASAAALHAGLIPALREKIELFNSFKRYLDDHAKHEPAAAEQAHVWGRAAQELDALLRGSHE